ncbi:hyaluronoglucosaminidase [Balamuthia mandrillaris]
MGSITTPMLPFLFLLVVGLLGWGTSSSFAACPHDRSDLTAFPTISSPNQNVVLTSGQKVKLSSSPVHKLGYLIVDSGAELIFDDVEGLALEVDWLLINKNAKLIMGSSDCPITHNIRLTFHGERTLNTTMFHPDYVDGSDGEYGSKGLAIASGASLQLYGELPLSSSIPTWTRLRATAQRGDTVLRLEDAVEGGWRVGDQIVIASTDFSAVYKKEEVPVCNELPNGATCSLNWMLGSESFPEQSEVHTIASVDGDSVTLEGDGLQFMHWGQDYQRAEVGLLSRRIVITGDASSDDSEFGGHVIIRAAKQLEIVGVQFTKMGQKGVLGRYPVHFHLVLDVEARDYVVQGNSFYQNFQRCIVIHNGQGIQVEDNVAFDNFGHCYFLEEGGERNNILHHNLGILVKPMPTELPDRSVIPTDTEPSIFWITNPDNEVTNNAAVGGKFGFWYILPNAPVGVSEGDYINHPEVRPRWTPLGSFADNVAHSCGDTGVQIDDMLRSDGTTELGSYNPRLGPYNIVSKPNAWQYDLIDAIFEGIIAYKNREYGVWTRGGPLRFVDLVLMDNRHGFNAVPGPSLLEDSLIVGESDNIGNPSRTIDYFNRSQPIRYPWETWVIKGHESYDNGGPQYVRNVEFRNFVSNEKRAAGALSCLTHGPFMLETRNKYEKLRFENANPVAVPDTLYDGPKGVNFFDVDGSVTGFYGGGWVVSNRTFLINDGCEHREEWNGYACHSFREGYVQFKLVDNTFDPDVPILGENGIDYSSDLFGPHSGETIRATFHSLHEGELDASAGYQLMTSGRAIAADQFQYMVNLQPRRAYTIRFTFNTPTPSDCTLSMTSSAIGDWMIFALPYPLAAYPFQITSTQWGSNPFELTEVYSMDELSASTYLYNTTTQHLFVYLRNVYGGVSHRWNFNDWAYDGLSLRILTSCSTKEKCAPKNFQVPNIPVPTFQEEKYRASLCHNGDAFLYFDRATKELHWNVPYDIGNLAASAFLCEDGFGEDYPKHARLESAQSPIRGVTPLSHDAWKALATGRLYVAIRLHDDRWIGGRIGCESLSCAPPDPVPVVQECLEDASGASVLVMYQEEAPPGWPRWGTLQWSGDRGNTTVDWLHTEQVLCGEHAVRLEIANGAFGFYHHSCPDSADANHEPRFLLDLAQYDHFEFFIRVGEGYGSLSSLSLRFGGYEEGQETEGLELTAEYVHNYLIDEHRWTRVRVPLSDEWLAPLHKEGNSVELRSIQLRRPWSSDPIVLYLDELRFVKVEGEEEEELMGVDGYVAEYEDSCLYTYIPPSGEEGSGAAALFAVSLWAVGLLRPFLFFC